MVVSGKGHHKVNGFVVYETTVYRSMTLEKYKELKKEDSLPWPDYITYFTRDAHDTWSSKLGTIKHSTERYGKYNEIPSGEFFLTMKGYDGNPKKGDYKIYLGSKNGSRVISGPHGDREGIAFHGNNPINSQGCLTTGNNPFKNNPLVADFINEIPDLVFKDRIVRVIVEEREVIEEVWDEKKNGTKKWSGYI